MYVATDLHGHTLYSDAKATPGAFVRTRQERGLRVIAISDHDCFAASRAGLASAEGTGMIFLPAAECTAFLGFGTDAAEQFHVLAYFPPTHFEGDRLEKTALYQRGLKVQARWKAFALAWIDTLGEVDRAALGGRGALALVPPRDFPSLQGMIDRVIRMRPNLYEDFRRHHVRFWAENPDLFAWSPEELIETIRADGGTDVVAHAVRYKNEVRRDEVLDYATGIEVYTSRHSESVAARFLAYAEAKEKHWTASTDDHQWRPYERPPSGTPVRTMERILGASVSPELISP